MIGIDTRSVHVNTFRVNIIKPLAEKLRPLVEAGLKSRFRRSPAKARRVEIQLEFWGPPKR
jgi:hypothetical protein